jgi:hypothetical protein
MYRKLSTVDFTASEQRTQKARGKKRKEEEEEEDEEEGWLFGNRFEPEEGGRDPFAVRRVQRYPGREGD